MRHLENAAIRACSICMVTAKHTMQLLLQYNAQFCVNALHSLSRKVALGTCVYYA